MQLIVTDGWLARSRVVHLTGPQVLMAAVTASVLLLVLSLTFYHWVLLKGAREGWPLIGPVVRLVVKDEFDQRDRFMRENLDAIARRLGELQARLVQLESLGERVSGLAGLNPGDIRKPPSLGGELVAGRMLSLEELDRILAQMDQVATQRSDWMTVMESNLFEQRIKRMTIPTQDPVTGGTLGSTFGWRIDPVTGQSALHTGLDFQADRGTPILAAAGGVVVNQQVHPAYGNMLEIDHGNDLRTLYAHANRFNVTSGDIVKRGQRIGEVGSTGRSTGPHLHFEVLVHGVPQDPRRFLDSGGHIAAEPSNYMDKGTARSSAVARR